MSIHSTGLSKSEKKSLRGSSIRIIRPTRLAHLFDCDLSTIWRWVQNGTLPQPIQIGPALKGWTEAEIEQFIERRRKEESADG